MSSVNSAPVVSLLCFRLNSVAQASLVEVYPVPSDRSMYYVRLRTDHYSFSIRSSCVTRSPAMFYQFRSILRCVQCGKLFLG